MIFLSLFAPFFISFCIGYLLIDFIFRKEQRPDLLVHLFLAGGLGLGLSASINFFSFVLFNRLYPAFPLSIHFVMLAILVVAKFQAARKNNACILNYKSLDIKTTAPFILILIAMIPICIQAKFYPMGGWDAWSVWNFKAKFLLLGEDKWQNLLDPILWRTSPHYPFLLPLINVWGWIFTKAALPVVPLITSVLFTFLTAGLLFSVLRHLTKNLFVVVAPLLLLTLPFYGILAISQYCDIIIGYFLLAGIYCLMEALNGKSCAYAILSGLLLGLLSFSKPEGMVGAILVVCLGAALLKADKGNITKEKFFILFFTALLLSSIPAVIFRILYSPGNQTYINGFFSSTKPITFYRLKMVLAFFLVELKSPKWNGIWILAAVGIILNLRGCFRKTIRLLPLFLTFYMGIILIYYLNNTYFEIKWWLQSSLNRILFSLLPTVILWIFLTVFQSSKSYISKRPKGR